MKGPSIGSVEISTAGPLAVRGAEGSTRETFSWKLSVKRDTL